MKPLESLRAIMREKNINYYIITSSDAHQSEYVASYYKGREFISGFTGSAATLLVGENEARLWTDGRYFIQANKELSGSGIELVKMGVEGYPTIDEWIEENINENSVLGVDGRTISALQYNNIKEISNRKKFMFKIEEDLLEYIWSNRPQLPKGKVFIHDLKYCGQSYSEKIKNVRKEMKRNSAKNYIISSLDDIAWLLNLRGNDIKYNPVFLSHLLINEEETLLFIDKSKIDCDLEEYLSKEKIRVLDYEEVYKYLNKICGKVILDEKKISAAILCSFNDSVEFLYKNNITTELKAIKNNVEIESMRNSQIRDGVAMVKFIKWLKENVHKHEITEIIAAEKLEEFRKENNLFKGLSFGTIAGYRDHAAMMHYSATEESDYLLENSGMLLVDSGAQYLDGTTDITRTIILGKITSEEKRDFTLVLKGHIALAKAKFLKGTTGENLDILARQPLWNEGIDYKCGTGHGVGFFLNVHEGPQGFRQSGNKTVFKEGMVITNEPGVYKTDKYGIRTENILLVKKSINNPEMGEFLEFEVISYCPIDLDGIDNSLLEKSEKEWLNNYHERVYKLLSPYLDKDEKEFLKEKTRKI